MKWTKVMLIYFGLLNISNVGTGWIYFIALLIACFLPFYALMYNDEGSTAEEIDNAKKHAYIESSRVDK